jgi:hypothetical protein
VLNCALTNDPNIPGLCPLTNRGGQMSEEERKAMFAKMGGGGGGGGGAPRGGGPAAPAADPAAPAGGQAPAGGPAPAPSGDPSSTPTPQPTSRPAPELSSPKLQALKDQREAYANFNPDPPAPVKDPRRKIDPDQAFKDALRQGKGLNEARAAEKNAQQEKDSAKAELKSLRSALKKDGVNFAGMDEAIDKELAKRDRRYSDAMEQYGKTTSARDKVLDRLNLAIAGEEQRIASSYERDQGKEQRAFEQAMKEKVRQDLAAERERRLSQESQAKTQAAQQKLAAKQAADAAKANDPVRQFAAKTRKAGAFIRALEAGDTETAKRMFPGADINTYASAAAGINGKSTRRAQLVRDFIREIN